MEGKTINYKWEELKALLIRMWSSGAVCYFVFFGTKASFDLFDSIFLASIIHFLFEEIILLPLIKGAFKTKANTRKKYKDLSSFRRIILWLYEFLEIIVVVTALIYTYDAINSIFKEVVIRVEPFGYAFVFTLYYYILYLIKYKFTLRLIQGK